MLFADEGACSGAQNTEGWPMKDESEYTAFLLGL